MEDRRNSEIPPKIRPSASSNARLFASRLTRKKSVDPDSILATDLRRCLNTADITLLALGHMVGSGVYVLTATVARNLAGPAIVLSFLLSGLASLLAALSYSELGVRYPNCGSAYSYTYLALGEVWAFTVGWSMALENAIGAAATAKACSGYVDSLLGGVVRNVTNVYVGESLFLSDHLDFFAAALILTFVFLMSFGVRVTSYLTNAFAGVNIVIILIIISVGAYFSDVSNWTNPATGGFMPYGWSGVLAGSASCFYAYVGFDAISATGEEARNPQKSIPRAMMISMAVSTFCYVGVSAVLTMMVNYKDIAEYSGLPEALASHGSKWSKVVVIIGAVSGMTTAIVGCLYSLTRVVYVMADDGLLFDFCAKVSVRTKTPLRAMYVFTVLSALLTLVLDLTILVEVMSIGTLLAYVVVSASVIVLRYRPRFPPPDPCGGPHALELCTISETNVVKPSPPLDFGGSFKTRFQGLRSYVRLCPGKLVTYCVASYCAGSLVLCSFVKLAFDYLIAGAWWAIFFTILFGIWVMASFGVILLHQQSNFPLRYKIPLVPLIPALSILLNIILAVNLHISTWLRLIFWMSIGLSMYLSYGVEHSKMDIIETSDPPRPVTWGASDTQAAFDERRKAGAAKRTKPPVLTTQSREFLFTNVDPPQ